MTEIRAHLIIRRAAIARWLRDCRARYGTCRGAQGRKVAQALKRQCGLS